MELKQVDTSKVYTYKEILIDYGVFDAEKIEEMTEDQCKWECEEINGDHLTDEILAAEGDWPDEMDKIDEF